MAKRDVVRFKLTGDYRIKVWFRDGRFGEVDIAALTEIEGYYFAPLREPDYFKQVSINPDFRTLHWPNDADIDPYILYAKATGEPLKIRVWREEVVAV